MEAIAFGLFMTFVAYVVGYVVNDVFRYLK